MDKHLILFNLKHIHDLCGEVYTENQDRDLDEKIDRVDNAIWFLIETLQKELKTY